MAYNPVTVPGWPSYWSDQTLAIGAPGGPNDVLRLGDGGNVTVGFGDGSAQRCIVDRNGADFVVYSSAVPAVDLQGNVGTFSQVMMVAVSPDGAAWYPFNYKTFQNPLVNPAQYYGLAGVTPTVGAGAGAQGGDAFDLGDVPALGGEACYVRLTDAWGVVADYGDTQPDPWQGGAGIDTIQALHTQPAPASLP